MELRFNKSPRRRGFNAEQLGFKVTDESFH